MDFIEKTLKMRAIRRDEIIDYFIGINGEDMGHGSIRGPYWIVEVSQEKLVALGAFMIPEISVVLRCQKEHFVEFYTGFFSKFLRAGG